MSVLFKCTYKTLNLLSLFAKREKLPMINSYYPHSILMLTATLPESMTKYQLGFEWNPDRKSN